MALAQPHLTPATDPALIERDAPLAALARHLDEAAAGSGRFVVIRGEAGIGKTAVLRAFLQAAPSDVRILAGACDGVSTPQPFGPLEDMVAALGPELRDLLETDARRNEIGRWLLDRLSMDGTHVVAIDDIQWADDATLELLAWLARRIESLRLLVVVTLRDGDGTTPSVTRMVGSVAALANVHQLPLLALTRDGIERLAGGRPVDVDELHRITAGNPFFASEVLTGGVADPADPTTIPLSILDAVRARVGRLDARGRRALQAAAVIGTRAEPWLLAAIAGEDLVGIDEALRAGLLTKVDGIAFRHELTRLAVLEDLPVIHGIALHRAALAALERAGATDTARLAYHAEGAAERAAIVRYATAAGRRALAAGALNESDHQFRRALAADGGSPAERVELLESLAEVRFLLNHLQEAVDLGREAVALRTAAGEKVEASRDLSALAIAAWSAGQGADAWQAAREALDLVERAVDSRELALACAILGRLGLSSGDSAVARSMSERAVEVGRRIEAPEPTAIGLATIGTLDVFAGDEAGWGRLQESLAIGRREGLPPIVDRALNNLAVAAFAARRIRESEGLFEEMERHSERSEIERCGIDTPRAEISLALGDWTAADVHARAAFTAPRTDPVDRALAMVVLARLAVRRGEPGWDGWLDEPARLERDLGTTQLRWPIASVIAEHAWVSGADDGDIVARLRAAYREACAVGDRWTIGDLGVWLWRLHDTIELDGRAPEPHRLEVAGRVAEATAAWEALEAPYEAALCLSASILPRDVRRAHGILVGLGATAVAHRMALRLRDLGEAVPRGPRAHTRANPAGLTEREAEIARLLGEGLSNAEIAERLVVSPRTVGHHVSAVLAKLAVPRRSAVAAAMSEAGAGR